MKNLLITLLSITLVATSILASPLVEQKPPAMVALLHGRVFAHGGGLVGHTWLGLQDNGSVLIRDAESGAETVGSWRMIDKRRLLLWNGSVTFRGFIHGGRQSTRFVFGPWECSGGNDGHALFEVVWSGC